MSSDPPFFQRVLRNAWKSISLPRSQYEGTLPISSPTSFTRMRSLTVALTQNHDSNHSPLYANAIEMEKREYLPRGGFSLSTAIFSLTFPAAFVIMYQQISGSRVELSLLGAAIVIGFAASASVMFIKHSYPRIAAILEKFGLLSCALGFFVMTEVFFAASSIIWKIIARLAWALTMLAFLIGCST